MATLLALHGPNLNLLGEREPEIYGSSTLADINQELTQAAESLGHRLACFQSNAEHDLIDRVHQAKREGVEFIIVNPGAFTHTSIALRDAFSGVALPFIEVHLSNVFAREEFRRHSYLSELAVAVISGAGAMGYRLALQVAAEKLQG